MPALVDFCSASVPARRPRAVADPDQVGAEDHHHEDDDHHEVMMTRMIAMMVMMNDDVCKKTM